MKLTNLDRCPPMALCKLAGWTKETLSQRVKGGIAVKVARGLYDAPATLANERSHQADKRDKPDSIQTARLRRAQAERVEIENAVRRKELVPVADVMALSAALMATISQMLNALDRRLPPRVQGKGHTETRLAIRHEVNAVRIAAATELRALGGEHQG